MRSVETGFLLAIAAFLVGFCALGLFYYEYSVELMRFPLLAAGCTVVVVAAQLVALRRDASPEAAKPVSGPVAGATALLSGAASWKVAWLFSIVPLVFLFGYPWGLAIYLLCFLRHAGASWGLALGAAASSLLLSYGLFIEMLGVSLPEVPFWWPGQVR